jgi:hypothetical protein
MLTEKENYLMTLGGEIPDWIPRYSIVKLEGMDDPATVMCAPSILNEFRVRGYGRDIWGVEYVATKETGGAMLPKPGEFILKDIRKWRDVIKAPDITGIDWELMVKEQIARSGINRKKSALVFNMHAGYFQNLMAFMGFTEGLMAMYEEPEEVMALFDYMCDFYCTVAEHCMPYYQPDVFSLMDDTAAWGAPFISAGMYHELVFPYLNRQAKFGRDAGIPINMHNCGKSACFIEDWLAMGVTAWDPAQTCNDLDTIKATYGDRLTIVGGWDSAAAGLLSTDVTDEEIYNSVAETVGRLAPGGRYVFCGSFLGAVDDQEMIRKNRVLDKAVNEICHNFYRS